MTARFKPIAPAAAPAVEFGRLVGSGAGMVA